tara:strand:+ start:13587 stop:14441 length:855 start_codon:yes stop_codon:yes gene_type:complete
MKNIFNTWRKLTHKYSHERVNINETTIKRVVGQYMHYGFVVITADRTCEAEKERIFGSKEPCTPEETIAQEELNIENQPKLESAIRAAGFGFVPVYGGYREKKEYIVKDGETIDSIVAQIGTPKEIFMQLNNLDDDTVLEPGSTVMIMFDTSNPEVSFLIGVPQSGKYTADEVKEFAKEMTLEYHQDSFFYKPPQQVDPNAYYLLGDGSVDVTFTDFTTNDVQQIFYTQLKKRPHERFTALTENMVYYLRKPPSGVAEARKRYGEEFYNLEAPVLSLKPIKIKR